LGQSLRSAALGLRVVGFAAGVLAVAVSVAYVYDELVYLTGVGNTNLGDVIVVLGAVSLGLSGCALMAQLPDALRARFRNVPGYVVKRRPVYGFGTMVAIGVGATLGSPLFILIPENISQYEIVSVASLVLATLLSVAMAKLYSDMYKVTKDLGMEGVGGPSFTQVAVGTRSVRYFVARLSMWVSNTALAAYTKIVFLIFVLDPSYLPSILARLGMGTITVDATVYTVAGAFIAWTILNILFEQKYLKALGIIQILMVSALLLILVYHSVLLGDLGGWSLGGLLNIAPGYGWVPALVINTGYLYLLFFGFQEIQSLERDSVERSKVPLLSWVKKGFTLDRTEYLGAAMVLSVVVAASVNIFYGLAVYASHIPLQESSIPALYIAERAFGPDQELLMAAAFLIATVTTFVPAFLAAARHLSALGEDGYMPRSVASLSWVFTLVAIFLLAVSNQAFLVNITDFMVLMSLGIISLSAVWLKRSREVKGQGNRLPILVGAGCFAFGGAIYAISPSVVVFGSVAVVFAYLIFDIMELGSLGSRLFLSVFGFISVLTLTAFGHRSYTEGILELVTKPLGMTPDALLFWTLLASSVILTLNVLVDVRILSRRTTS
jgi:amino acid transporter